MFGLLCAVLLFPITLFAGEGLGLYITTELALWIVLLLYSVLLARWSHTPLLQMVFPLGVLLISAVTWPWFPLFYGLALLTLAWFRSGICFKGPFLRLAIAEIVATAGGGIFVAVWNPQTPIALSLSLWLFFLIQSLYFFFLPNYTCSGMDAVESDAFETAFQEAEKITG